MTEAPEIRTILKQFPWARINKDGSFSFELALAMRFLLGSGPNFGWWAMEEPDILTVKSVMTPSGYSLPTYNWGGILLSDKHFDDESGWRLAENDIPWLTFTHDRKAPSFPPTFEHNWTSYYKWRGLPLKSMAVLLLHWPLSVYRLLYLLGFSSAEGGVSERRKLNIHCLGVEVELNCLPVFGELALLLPYTDLDIVMFGQRAYDIAQQAKPPALAAQKYVYEYNAPKQCGSGSIRIQLYKTSPIWDPRDILSRQMIPDVLIGLNAGMSMYETWHPIFSTSRALAIPFAITEFSRLSLAEDLSNYKSFVEEARRDLAGLLGREKIEVLAKSLDHPPCSAINPFMRPGQRQPQTSNMPTAINGFSRIVTPRPELGNLPANTSA